jgi:hypothetical protein
MGTTTIRIDPDQLDAIRGELRPVLDAVRAATARAAAAEIADTSVDYRVGQRDGADLTVGRVMAVLDRIARQGVVLVDD